MRDGGKGDTPRPLGVPMEVFDKNFDAIFGKKPKEKQTGEHDRSNGGIPTQPDKPEGL